MNTRGATLTNLFVSMGPGLPLRTSREWVIIHANRITQAT
jgi:hypothetical protein